MSVRLATLHDLPALRAELRGAERLALDTEFHAERRWLPELFLVQLRIDGGGTWLVDPLIEGLLTGLAEDLLRPEWVVHGGQHDLRILQVMLGGLPDTVWDTQIAAGLVGTWFPAPYQALVEEHLGVRLEKAETLSDWSRRPLEPGQIHYAALDVLHLLPLWDALWARLGALDRTALARQACDEARDAVANPADDDDAWRSLQGAAGLKGPELAVLQALASWRERRARETNQPARAVLGDAPLLELARRRPITAGSLMANRRMPRALGKVADELADLVARAQARPEWAWPAALHRRTPDWRRASFLQVWIEALGLRESFAASLVLPWERLERVLLARPSARSEISGPLGSWRDELVGDPLWAALQGRVALRLDGADLGLAEEGSPPARTAAENC